MAAKAWPVASEAGSGRVGGLGPGRCGPGQGCLSTLARVFNQGNSRPMGSSVHGHLSVHSQHGWGVG